MTHSNLIKLYTDSDIPGVLDCLLALKEKVSPSLYKDIMHCASRYNNLKNEEHKGVISYENLSLTKSQILDSLLHLIDKLPLEIFYTKNLNFDFLPSQGSIDKTSVKTPSYDPELQANEYFPAIYARVKVTNTSTYNSVRNCMCHLVHISKISNEKYENLNYYQSLRLPWNFEWDNAPPDVGREIFPKSSLFCDVFFTYSMPDRTGIALRALSYNKVYRNLLEFGNSYKLDLSLTAEKEETQFLSLSVKFGDNWDSFEIQRIL
jgi:hypothetical protein